MVCSVIIHAGMLIALNTPMAPPGADGLGHLPVCQIALTEFCAATEAMSRDPDRTLARLMKAQKNFIAACADELPQPPSGAEIPTPARLKAMKIRTGG